MYGVLFAFGIFATAAGVAMVGFGISINEFSLGNTLLTTGTIAIVGGMILVGLATAVQQLLRIAEALTARPQPRPARPLDPFEPPAPGSARAGPASGRIPFPMRPVPEGRGRGTGPLEPRLAAAPSIDASKEGAFEGPRIPFPPRVAKPESHEDEDADETPLSPGAAQGASLTEVTVSRTPEPASTSASDITASHGDSDLMSISRLDLSLRPAPPSETSTQNEFFDSLWPAAVRPSKTVETPAKPEEEPAASEAPPPRKEEQSAPEIKQAEPVEEPQAISILKSGIIDEMAYTLYSDGSIEAEMPQGIMRFSSIAELRGYLEKSS